MEKQSSVKEKTNHFISHAILLYVTDSWTMNVMMMQPTSFHLRCLKRLINIQSNGIIKNEMSKAAGSESLTIIKRRKYQKSWKCLGHVLRMNETRVLPQSLKWTPSGQRKRKRERPRETQTIHNDMLRWR